MKKEKEIKSSKKCKTFNYKEINNLNSRELFIELEKVIEGYVKLQMTKKDKYKFTYPINRMITVLEYERFKKYEKTGELIKHLTSLIEDAKVSVNSISKVITKNIEGKEEIPNSYFKTILFNFLKG